MPPWTKPQYKLIAAGDAERLTGLASDRLLQERGVEALTRITGKKREDMLRIYVEEGTRLRDDGQVELKCPPEIEAQFFEAVTKMDFWALLPKVKCPALVLWGPDGNLHGRLADGVQEALPQARTVIVPGTSHFLPQERPDEVARLMEEFLSD